MSFARRFLKQHPPKVEVDQLTAGEATVLRDILAACGDGLPPQETFWPRHERQLLTLRQRGLLEPLDYGEREANGTAVTLRGRRALEAYDDWHD